MRDRAFLSESNKSPYKYMLDKLTKDQEKLMAEVRQEWLNRIFKRKVKKEDDRCIELIKWMYKISNLKEPMVVFLDSPLAVQCGANMSKGSQVGSQVWSQVESQVWSQVESQVRSQVESQVRSQVRSQVWSQVWSQVRSQVGSQVRSQVESQKLEFFSFAYRGEIYDYDWMSFYDFFQKIGIVNLKELDTFKELFTYDIFMMIQLDGMCFVSRHPEYIKRDERNNLHSEDGMAIKWKDGYGQYYLHGVSFDEKLYKKVVGKKMSFKKIMEMENMEQRMVALKTMDADKLLKGAKAKLLDKSERGNELYKIDKGLFSTDAYFLKYQCPSTGRVYISGIDPDYAKVKKADECMSWKFNLTINEYNDLINEA